MAVESEKNTEQWRVVRNYIISFSRPPPKDLFQEK